MILVLHFATHLNFKHCQVCRQTVFNDLLPDNDGVDDFLKSLDIPAQETCSNVPISKSMCQFPVPMINNCQNITINYNIFLLNRLFVKVWVLYYFYTTAKILGSYYGMAESSSSVHILFPLSYFSSSFQ